MKEVGATVVFHLGRAEQPVNNIEIQIEAEENNDIVQHDIKEHAYNKTLVSLMSLKWFDKVLSDKTPVVILSDSRTYIDMSQWSETIGNSSFCAILVIFQVSEKTNETGRFVRKSAFMTKFKEKANSEHQRKCTE